VESVRDLVLSEDEAFKLLAFLITSSRLCIDEPENYGTCRLLDAASRLLGFLLASEAAQDREFYAELKTEIDNSKTLALTDEEGYARFVKDLAGKVATKRKARAQGEAKSH
jgi:hypothetical protein